MKIYLVILSFLLCNTLLSQDASYYVHATINDLPPGQHQVIFYLLGKGGDSTVHTDTISQEKNSFSFSGKTDTERYAGIKIRRLLVFDFALGPADTAIIQVTTRDVKPKYTISGTIIPRQMADYLYGHYIPQAIENINRKRVSDSLELNASSNTAAIEKAQQVNDSLYQVYFDYNTAFADTTKSASAMYFALSKYFEDTGKFYIYENVERALRRFPPGPILTSLEKGFKSNQIPQTKFVTNDTLSFSMLPVNAQKELERIFRNKKQKLMLIDFWASWCAPCREEFPFLDKAFTTFNDKGFDILSISIDKDESAWKKAMKSLHPLWSTHVIDTDAWNSKTIKNLNIKSIPRNYLVDKHGRIYGKDLRGRDLRETLERLL